jgi:spore coat protein U-like protein
MKKTALVVAMIAVIALAGTAMAADNNTLTVTATVLESCKFSAATSNLAFNLDPAVASDVSFPATIQYACTNGTTPSSVAEDGGQNNNGSNRLFDGGAGYIDYAVALGPVVAGTGLSSWNDLTVTVSVLGANYVAAAPGVYTDDVVITIAP